jgi:hypothetical protein
MDEEAELDDGLGVVARDRIQVRYEHAAIFFQFSEMKRNWFLPKGWTMLTPEDVFENPMEGVRSLYGDHHYCHLESLKSSVAIFNPVEIDAWSHNLNDALFPPSPNDMKQNRG